MPRLIVERIVDGRELRYVREIEETSTVGNAVAVERMSPGRVVSLMVAADLGDGINPTSAKDRADVLLPDERRAVLVMCQPDENRLTRPRATVRLKSGAYLSFPAHELSLCRVLIASYPIRASK